MAANNRQAKDLPFSRFEERPDPNVQVFVTRPSADIIEDLRRHMREDGRPDLWRWNLQTRPGSRSMPVIVATGIDVPEDLRSFVGLAPCPICSIKAGRYYHGVLTWYPDEKALRVIGRECGHQHFGAEFAAAERIFEQEQQADADFEYLAEHLPLVQQLLQIIEDLSGTADALDHMKQRTFKGLSAKVAKEIYRHVDSYKGLVIVNEREVRTPKGPEIVREVVSLVSCDGWRMLSKSNELAWSLLQNARRDLEALDIRTQDGILDFVERGAVEMAKARRTLVLAAARIQQAYRVCLDVQAFHSEDNLERMRVWSYEYRDGTAVDLRRDRIGYVFHHKPNTVRIPPQAPELTAALPNADVLSRFDTTKS